MKEVLDEVVDILPSPLDVRPETGTNANGAGEVEIKPDLSAPAARIVFKTLSEQHLGDMSLVRLFAGTIETGKELMNTTHNRTEKLGTLYHLIGKDRVEAKKVVGGDMFGAVKLKETHTGDTLADKSRPVRLAPPAFPSRSRRSASAPRTRVTRRRWSGSEPAARGGSHPGPVLRDQHQGDRWCAGWATSSSR